MQLNNLSRKDAFYHHDGPAWIRNIWPRPESFNWFIKNNRDKLVNEGAIVRLGRDYFIDAEAFPATAERILGVSCQDTDA